MPVEVASKHLDFVFYEHLLSRTLVGFEAHVQVVKAAREVLQALRSRYEVLNGSRCLLSLLKFGSKWYTCRGYAKQDEFVKQIRFCFRGGQVDARGVDFVKQNRLRRKGFLVL